MPKTNAQNVRAYYGRNKKLVLFRKAMKRCRENGKRKQMNGTFGMVGCQRSPFDGSTRWNWTVAITT